MIDVATDGTSYRNDASLSGSPAVTLSGRLVDFTNAATGSIMATSSSQPALLITGKDAGVVNLAGGIIANYEGAAIVNASGPVQTYVTRIQNYGTIIGSVKLTDARDSYLEAGTHIGALDLGGGNDIMDLQSFNGNIEGGSGEDVLILSIDLLSTGVTGFESLVLRDGAFNIAYLSGLTSVTLAQGASHNFLEARNPLVDLALAAGYVTIGRDSVFRSVVGTDAADALEIDKATVLGDIRLGGGNDSLTYDFNNFSVFPPKAPVLGGIVDGGAGDNALNLSVDGGRTIDARMFTNFQFLNTGTFTSIIGDLRLTHVDGYRLIEADEGRLVLDDTNSPEARLRIQDGGTVTIGENSVIGRIGDDLPYDGRLAPGFIFTQTIVNNGTVQGDVRLYVGNETYDGREGSVGGTIYGDQGDDIVLAGHGDDRISGGRGFDVIDGGAGTDTLLLDGVARDYTVLRTPDGYSVRHLSETDRISNVEQVRFTGAVAPISFAAFEARSFDPFGYLASYADLRAAFGTDAAAATRHFEQAGRGEGRDPGLFDARLYLASNIDLALAFGADTSAATEHYVRYGIAEGRETSGFDPLLYAASNPGIALTIGADRDALLLDYLTQGARFGRSATGFDAIAYAASNPDLVRAFGTDTAALTYHYVVTGIDEGRATDRFDAIEYAASNPDLARAFGIDEAALTYHYVAAGLAEGRVVDSFDTLLYAATNVDLARAFGSDEGALARHYVATGLAEGRVTAGFDAVAYLLSNPDLGDAGLGAAGALRHWVDAGVDEGRLGDSLFGREQASHGAVLDGTLSDSIGAAGDHDWFALRLAAGQSVQLDLAGGGASPLADPLLELFDGAGRRLAIDNDGGPGLGAEIRFTAAQDGLYYLAASSFNAAGTGSYSLAVDLLI